MRIERSKTIALAVDYQERLLPAMHEREKLIQNSVFLLEGLKILQVPVVLTQQYTKGLGQTVPEIAKAAGTAEYVEKISFSALEPVRPQIEGMKYVLVCGVEAHICVLQTVIDLRAAGYIPVLVEDCISSRKEYQVKSAIERAKCEGAIPATCESVLFELLGQAGTPQSKQIQRLVK